MRKTLRYHLFVFSAIFCLGSATHAQDQALQNLIHGKKFFWEAKFSQALATLKKVTQIDDAKPEYLFEAYLYTGFILLRQSAPAAEVTSVFGQAITIDPERKLDELVIPPDLTAPFYRVRNEIVGCLFVRSFPAAEVVAVKGDSVLFEKKTPFILCDIVTKKYQLLFSQAGYQQEFVPLGLTPGQTDTLEVALHPLLGGNNGGSALKWVVAGGIAAGAAAVVYKVALSGDSTEPSELLPTPPSHPTDSSQ